MKVTKLVRLLLFTSLAVLQGCGGGRGDADVAFTHQESRARSLTVAANPAAPLTDILVVSLTKMSEIRVGRTTFDYTFRVTVRNTGQNATGVSATLSAAPFGSTIVDGSIQFGDLLQNQTKTADDTITIRQDRAIAFDQTKLVFQFSGTPTQDAPGVLLSGAPNELAIDTTSSHTSFLTSAQLAIDVDESGSLRYYTHIADVVIANGATVQQVNAALSAVGARIVWSMPKFKILTIYVPATGFSQLRAIVDQLSSSPAFELATSIIVHQTAAIPSSMTVSDVTATGGRLRHHAAIGALNAWNAASAFKPDEVEIVVIDTFFPSVKIEGYSHGDHVRSILVGNSDNTVGMFHSFPRTGAKGVKIVDIDARAATGLAQHTLMRRRLIEIFKLAPTKNFILNFSLGYSDDLFDKKYPLGINMSLADIKNEAHQWRTFVRSLPLLVNDPAFDYEKQVVQVSAAGNNGGEAKYASVFNAAALLEATTLGADIQQPLRNSLVVENRSVVDGTASASLPKVGCLRKTSNVNGNVGAIGEAVYWYNPETKKDGWNSGTSFAAPQVAGLAAMYWSVKNELQGSDVVKVIIANSTDVDLACVDSLTPVIDAYATLLTADDSAELLKPNGDPNKTRVRRALLDADGNSRFNLQDSKAFVDAIAARAGGTAFVAGSTDFSRFDLNGAGSIGGLDANPFNLDASVGQNFGSAYSRTSYLKGVQTVGVNEELAYDFQILCYYVYSSLWVDGDAGRASFETYARQWGLGCGVQVYIPPSPTGLYFTATDFRPSQLGVDNPSNKICEFEFVEVNPPFLRTGLDLRLCSNAAWRLINPRGTFRIALTVTGPGGVELAYAESDPVTFNSGPGVVGIQSFVCNAERFTTQVVGGGEIGTVISASPRGNGTLNIDSCGTWGAISGGVECQRRSGDPVDTLVSVSGKTPSTVYNDGVGVLSAKLNGSYLSNYYARPLLYFGFGGSCR